MTADLLRRAPGLALALLLGGCGSSTVGVAPEAPATPPPGAAQPPRAADRGADAAPLVAPGLTALPSERQVALAVPVGQSDPFLPQLRGPAVAPAPGMGQSPGGGGLPEGFSFQGVILSGGVPQALVQYGAESGTLRPGDRGGPSNPLLPAGWSVAAIDVQRGRLTLRQGGQRLSVDL